MPNTLAAQKYCSWSLLYVEKLYSHSPTSSLSHAERVNIFLFKWIPTGSHRWLTWHQMFSFALIAQPSFLIMDWPCERGKVFKTGPRHNPYAGVAVKVWHSSYWELGWMHSLEQAEGSALLFQFLERSRFVLFTTSLWDNYWFRS